MGWPQVAQESGQQWRQVSCAVLLPAPSDYSAVSQEVVFPAGTTHRSVVIPIVDDSVLENMEFFSVSVTVPASHLGVVSLGLHIADVFITDDDGKC